MGKELSPRPRIIDRIDRKRLAAVRQAEREKEEKDYLVNNGCTLYSLISKVISQKIESPQDPELQGLGIELTYNIPTERHTGNVQVEITSSMHPESHEELADSGEVVKYATLQLFIDGSKEATVSKSYYRWGEESGGYDSYNWGDNPPSKKHMEDLFQLLAYLSDHPQEEDKGARRFRGNGFYAMSYKDWSERHRIDER